MSTLRIVTADFRENGDMIFGIRNAVFVIEQSVPEEIEMDDLDDEALHVLAFMDDIPIGTGRITTGGRIGRMAVLSEYRRQGVGREILTKLVAIGQTLDLDRLYLSAQCQAIPFYERMGFVAEGLIYKEAGIDHQRMVTAIDRA